MNGWITCGTQRLYVSLSEVQTKQEEDLAKNPLSMVCSSCSCGVAISAFVS